jgi:S-adenosylmethionine decarboxylase
MTLKGPGFHLCLDMRDCEADVGNPEFVKGFLDSLPALVGMTLIKESEPFFYEAEDPLDSGVTGVAILAESHVSFHSFVNRNKYCFLDLFSCKSFDVGVAAGAILTVLKPDKYDAQVNQRGLNFPND